MSPESRRWKHIETNVEVPPHEERVELTPGQKHWLERAWKHSFGFIPNAVPIYNEREGFALRPGIKIHWHHINPVGESIRLDGVGHETYNNPRNIVPVCAANHTGANSWEGDFIIHEDTLEAIKQYHHNHAAFQEMSANRNELTERGLIYHNADYDLFFLDLADRVVSRYELECPQDTYP